MRTLMMVEQLRRSASGGIGTYINGLLQGFDALAAEERPDLELLASRFAGHRSGLIRCPSSATPSTARRCRVRS